MANFIEMIFKTATGSLVRIVDVYQRNIKKNMFKKSKVAKAIKASMKAWFASLKKKPSQKSDYILLGDSYYSKRLFMGVLVLVVVLMTIGNSVLLPLVRGKLYTPTISMADPLLSTYSGKVKMVNREKVLVYEGLMAEGKCTGFGRQYDDLGQFIYEGEFLNDLYQGEGTLYNDMEKPLYEGAFLNNLYHGIGKYYDTNGQLVYEGEFANGYYEGTGKLYDASETLIYSGKFSLGLQNGYGVTYYPDGLIQYSGEFVNGVFSGEGTLLSETGVKQYSGHFSAGQFDGLGKQFNKQGRLQYEGQLSLGQYNGYGKLYSDLGVLVYEGQFAQGLYSGTGKLYEAKTGLLLYSGNFDKGLFHGPGAYYTAQDKRYEGEWVAGGIAFESLLTQPSTAFRKLFFETGEMIKMESSYALSLPKTGLSVVLNYPDEVIEPLIQKIIVVNDDLLSTKFKGLTLEAAKKTVAPAPVTLKNVTVSKLKEREVYEAFSKEKTYQIMSVLLEGVMYHYYYNTSGTQLIFIEIEMAVEEVAGS